jgi:hypothetical protein
MARTNKKYIRLYIDGYDMSGYTRDAGTLGEVSDAVEDAAVTDAVKNALVGQTTISCGPINAILDNDGVAYPAGMFSTFGQAGTNHVVSVAIGTLNAPAIGDPVFSAALAETSFQVSEGTGFVSVNLGLDKAVPGSQTLYDDAFGYILHPFGTETGTNAANQTIEMGGSATALGGIFVYHLFKSVGGGTVVIKMQDATDGLNRSEEHTSELQSPDR